MVEPVVKTPLLKGIKEICNRFELSEGQFYMFLNLGLPVTRINRRWYGHEKTIDAWLQHITNPNVTQKKIIDVPIAEIPRNLLED